MVKPMQVVTKLGRSMVTEFKGPVTWLYDDCVTLADAERFAKESVFEALQQRGVQAPDAIESGSGADLVRELGFIRRAIQEAVRPSGGNLSKAPRRAMLDDEVDAQIVFLCRRLEDQRLVICRLDERVAKLEEGVEEAKAVIPPPGFFGTEEQLRACQRVARDEEFKRHEELIQGLKRVWIETCERVAKLEKTIDRIISLGADIEGRMETIEKNHDPMMRHVEQIEARMVGLEKK